MLFQFSKQSPVTKCITGLWQEKKIYIEGGNFKAKLSLNKFIVAELCWLLNSIPGAASDICLPKVHFKTDAWILGWGATDEDNQTGGFGQVTLHPAI